MDPIVRHNVAESDVTLDRRNSTISAHQQATLDMAARRRQLMTQQSTVATRRQHAVCVRRAYKQYGSKKNPNIILDGLNMTVPKGTM